MNYATLDCEFIAFALAVKFVVGSMVGIVVASLFDLFALGGWYLAGFCTVLILMVVGFLRLTDGLFQPAFDKLFENAQRRPVESIKAEPRRSSWIALSAGLITAIIATRFVPASNILAYFYG